MSRILFLLVFSVASFSALARQYMGYKVIEAPFQVADGTILTLPITDAGPIPAETRQIKIEIAGFRVGPSKDDPKRAVLIWQFGFTNKSLKKIESVSVTEIASSGKEVEFVKDDNPTLKDKYWMGETLAMEASQTVTPWLFQDKASIYVFRFVIKPVGKEAIVLHQPTWFSAPAKEYFRKQIASISGG